MAYYGNRPRGRGNFNGNYNPRPNRFFQLQRSRFTFNPRIATPQITPNLATQSFASHHVQQCINEDPQEFLEKHSINIIGEDDIKPLLNLENSILDEDILITLKNQNIKKPTPIQSVCWPLAIKGRDVVGIAQTGSGKTLAFILPALMYIKKQPSPGVGDGPICLVMCPTRELAQQVQQVADTFGKPLNILNACIYGGAMPKRQTVELKNSPHIVIATPGRLITLLESCETSLNLCSYLILDEADRMLDLGFEKQIQNIAQYLRPDRQTLMFSATWPKEVHALAEDMLRDYVKVVIGDKELTANCNIAQMVEVCQHREKMNKLYNLISSLASTSSTYKMIIFVRTKRKCNILNSLLNKRGWPVSCIHGDKQQADREKVLSDFKNGTVPILVATSVASRGLDVEDINYVINFDFPDTMEDYIHRIGRTARSSKTGTAFSYFTERSYHLAEPFIQVLKNAGQYVHPQLYTLAKKFPYEPKKPKEKVYGQRPSKGYNAEEDSDSEDSDGENGNPNVTAPVLQELSKAQFVATSQTESTTNPPNFAPYPGASLPSADPITKAIGNFIYAKNPASFFPLPTPSSIPLSFTSLAAQQPTSNFAAPPFNSSSSSANNINSKGSLLSSDQQQDAAITTELARVNRLFEQMQELANNMKAVDKSAVSSFSFSAHKQSDVKVGPEETALDESADSNRKSGPTRWSQQPTHSFKSVALGAPVLQRLEPPRSKLGIVANSTTTMPNLIIDPKVKGDSNSVNNFLKAETPKCFSSQTPQQPSLLFNQQPLNPPQPLMTSTRLLLKPVAKIPEKTGVGKSRSRSRSRVGRRGDNRAGRSNSRRRNSPRGGSKDYRNRSRYSKESRAGDNRKRSSRSRDRRRRTRSPARRRKDSERGRSPSSRRNEKRRSRSGDKRSLSRAGKPDSSSRPGEVVNNPAVGAGMPQGSMDMLMMNNFMKAFMGGTNANAAAPMNIMNNMMTMMMMAMGAAGAAAVQQQQPQAAMSTQLFSGTNSSANDQQTFSNYGFNTNSLQQQMMGAGNDSSLQLKQQQQLYAAGQGLGLPGVMGSFNMASQQQISPIDSTKQPLQPQQQLSRNMTARPAPGNFINNLPASNDGFAANPFNTTFESWRDGNDRDNAEDNHRKGKFDKSQSNRNDRWRPPPKRHFR